MGEKSSKPLNDAVFPTSIIFREDGQNVLLGGHLATDITCPNNPLIVFPEERISGKIGRLFDNEIDIVPNPASEYFKISGVKSSEISKILVYDLSGMIKSKFQPSTYNQYSILGMPVGIYTIHIVGIDGSLMLKKLNKTK